MCVNHCAQSLFPRLSLSLSLCLDFAGSSISLLILLVHCQEVGPTRDQGGGGGVSLVCASTRQLDNKHFGLRILGLGNMSQDAVLEL
jgi:hypothetical protein